MVSFQRPTGAAADLRELEYVSALQQTQDGSVRRDGSIRDVDIQLFLKSRYGILVSMADIQNTILHGFGNDHVIDLSELTAMLLIPTLIKSVSPRKDDNDDQDQVSYPSEGEQQDSAVHPKPGLIQSVLSMILRDVTGSSEPPILSVSLLKDILLAYGEEEMSNDEELLREMINAAGQEGDVFTVEAFSRALTSDISLYDVNKEDTLTTNYHDVMKAQDPLDITTDETDDLSLDESMYTDANQDDLKVIERGMNNKTNNEPPAKIHKFWSSPAIDFTACRYSSKFIVIFLWTGFVISYIAYFATFIREQTSWYFYNFCPDNSFGCRIALAILEWLFILATLCGFGLAYIAFSSIGNGIEDTKKWTRIIAIAFIGFFTWTFFLLLYQTSDTQIGTVIYTDEDGNVVDEEDVIVEKSEAYESVVYFLALIIGNIVIFLEFYMMFGDTIRKRCMEGASAGVIRFFTSTGIKAEAGNKRAAAVKMNALVDNAREIHSLGEKDIDHGETSFGAGLLNFSVKGEQFEEAGGFVWTWKRMFSKELYDKEGVWISARLLAGNFSQLLISIFVLTYGIAFTGKVVDEWEKGKADPTRYLYMVLEWLNVYVPVEEYSDAACASLADGSNGVLSDSQLLFFIADNTTCATIADEAIYTAMQRVSDSLYPQERYMVEVPMIVATALAFLTTLALVVVYIPSVASTTLQFRTGVIPFFRNDYNFELYRSRLDQVTILLGSMFWSALYASALVGIVVGAVVFLFLWQATRAFFVNLLAVLIGLVCTIGIKICISVFLLRKVYAAFYRKKLNQANIVSLALECIMVGFAIGTALGRAIKLVLISALYIGRIDTPLLAPGVGVGPLMDRYPFIFRQDILALEAHRHPYIDLVGKLYLMKLRFGDRFANRAGYCYRLIFTVALLPWLRKYRVIARPSVGGGGNDSPCNDEASALRRTTILPRSSILLQSAQMASINGNFVDSAVLMMNESGDVEIAKEEPQDPSSNAHEGGRRSRL